MSPDLKIGLIQTLYATWLHNNFAIGLFLVISLCALLLIFKPRRRFVLFLFGFLFLLLQFEYQKHFGKSLEDQTINSVIIGEGSLKARSFMEDFFQKLVPFALWFGGWGLIALGVGSAVKETKTNA